MDRQEMFGDRIGDGTMQIARSEFASEFTRLVGVIESSVGRIDDHLPEGSRFLLRDDVFKMHSAVVDLATAAQAASPGAISEGALSGLALLVKESRAAAAVRTPTWPLYRTPMTIDGRVEVAVATRLANVARTVVPTLSISDDATRVGAATIGSGVRLP